MTTSTSHSGELTRTITVGGFGRASVRPDIGDLRIGVTITESTVEAARSASATVQSAVLAKLRALGIQDADLRTSIVGVNPQYDYSAPSGPPRLVGYTFTNLVSAVVRDIDKVGNAIDGALDAGATTIDQIAFRVSEPASAEAQARAAAVADARAKADTLAAAAGVSLAGVVAITEGGGPSPFPRQLEAAAFAAKDAGTPIEPGASEITATVTITYLIEP